MSDRSTVQSIALDRLIAHPDNPNRMSSSSFAKLVRNIEQTGRYEPLIVRPYREKPRHSRRGKAEPRSCERTKPLAPSEAHPERDRRVKAEGVQESRALVTPAKAGVQRHREELDSRLRGNDRAVGVSRTAIPANDNENQESRIEHRGRFQIINGYHRWQALRQLGYRRADVIVWDVDDDKADLLLATLNRLVGSDELSRKISLLKKLSKKMNARELSKLIPQTPGQIKRLVNLRIPKAPAWIPSDRFANPLVFFVSDEQKKVIEEALSLVKHQVSSLTMAEAKAETLTLIAQHFIDTNVQGYDENEDQVCPA